MKDRLHHAGRAGSRSDVSLRGSLAVTVLAAIFLLPGCGLFGGVRVEAVATSVQKPSNVALYLSVAEGDAAITELKAENFRISEDGQQLSPEQTQQTLLPREVAAIHRTVLLLDLSGAIEEGEARSQIARAAARFVDRVREDQAVTVYAFDGGTQLRLVGEYGAGSASTPEEIPAIANFSPRDPSSNLNAAVIEGLKQLDARLMSMQKPVRVGTLVVLARGPDLAGRATEEELRDALDDTEHHVFAIGVGDDGELRLDTLGPSGTVRASSMGTLTRAFEEAAAKVTDTHGRYYLLSYCSPARAGERQLTIEVVTKGPEGEEKSGRYHTEFDATGFTSGCNPKARPRFVVPPPKQEPRDDEAASSRPSPPAGTSSPKPAGGSPEPPPPSEDADDTIVPPPSKPGYAQ